MRRGRINAQVRAFAAFFIIAAIGIPTFVTPAIARLSIQQAALKHGWNFLWLMVVAAIGWWGLKVYRESWTARLWLPLYGISCAVLLLAGVIDLLVYSLPDPARFVLAHYRILLLNPAVYTGIYFLARMNSKAV